LEQNSISVESATKFHGVKTSSGTVVEQSVSYETISNNQKYRTEGVSYHLNYWLKLTFPIVASTAHAVSGIAIVYKNKRC